MLLTGMLQLYGQNEAIVQQLQAMREETEKMRDIYSDERHVTDDAITKLAKSLEGAGVTIQHNEDDHTNLREERAQEIKAIREETNQRLDSINAAVDEVKAGVAQIRASFFMRIFLWAEKNPKKAFVASVAILSLFFAFVISDFRSAILGMLGLPPNLLDVIVVILTGQKTPTPIPTPCDSNANSPKYATIS